MKKITKIKNAIKRKVNESRLRDKVSSILDDALPNILAEIDQLDQAFLDAKPVKEEEDLEELDVRKTHGDKRIENPATGNAIKLRTALKAKKGSAVYSKGKAMYNALKDEPTNEGKLTEAKVKGAIDKASIQHLALDYLKGTGVLHKISRKAYQTWLKGLKNSYNNTQARLEIMKLVKLGNIASKISKSKHQFWMKDMLGEGKLTEAKKIKPHDLGYRMNLRRARAEFNRGESIAATSKSGKGTFKIDNIGDFPKYPSRDWDYAFIVKEGKLTEATTLSADDILKKMKDDNFQAFLRRHTSKQDRDTLISGTEWKKKIKGKFTWQILSKWLTKFAGLEAAAPIAKKLFEGKLNEDHFKKGQKVKYQLDRGSSKALRPSTGTISNVKKMGKYYQYTIQDGGPVPVWGAEIIGLAEGRNDPKIGCLKCDEVNTRAKWKKNKGVCPSCNDSTRGVAEGKLNEEDYKYKKYVAKAFKDILDAQFDFRHAMGVKQLTNKDMKLKKKADAIYKAIIDLQKDMKSKGLTEYGGLTESIASAERWFENMKYYYNTTALRSPDLKDPKDKKHFNKLVKKYFSSIREGKLTEVQAMNMDTVPYNTVMKMKPGSTIKMKDGKIRTKDKFGNWRANTDRNDIIVNRDIVKHMKGMKGYSMGNGRIQIEGKSGRKI